MPPRPSPAASRRPRVPNPVLFKTLTASIVENLEQRYLLTTGGETTDADLIAGWNSMSAAARHAIAVVEYNNPDFQAALNADLAALGLDPIVPQPGTIPADTGKSKHHRRPRHHKINLFHQKKPRHHRKTDPTPPVVTDVNYYYDQPLPNQLAFTFDQDVTATSWNSALTVIDLNSGTTLAASGTYSSALHTVVYDLNASAALPTANYAAILHTDQITDTTHSLAVVGSDSVAGHDFETSFFFTNADFNRDRVVNLGDINIISAHFNAHPATFTQGDANFDSYVNIGDVNLVSQLYNSDLALLSPVTAATAYVASSSSADIFWDAPSDTLVTAFDLYRNSTLLASNLTDTGYLDTGLSYNTTYNYFVVSKDTYGNSSWESPELAMAIVPIMPTLSVTGATLSAAGAAYTLTGTLSNATAGVAQTWSVDWGDGSPQTTYSGTGATLSHTFLLPADDYQIDVKVTQSASNATYLFDQLLDISVSGSMPSVAVSGPPSFAVGSNYTFLASLANPDGCTLQQWTIDWGDAAGASTYSASTSAFTHTYTDFAPGGTYTILAMADTDSLGEFYSTLLVTDSDPRANVAGATATTAGSTYTLTSTYSDPGGHSPTQWTIEWGDGNTSTYSGNPGVYTHVYHTASPTGGFPIAAVAQATGGASYPADWLALQVSASTPTISISAVSSTVTVGSNITLLDSFFDPAGVAPNAWTIAWGDGVSSFATGSATAFTHAYTLPGTFTLSATASTAHGNYTRTLPVSVADHATFSITAPSGTAGASYLLGVNFTDPGSTETPSTYSVNWGDGSTSTYSNPTQYEGTFSHDYSTYGTETLSVTATTSQGTYYQTAVASIAIPPLTLMRYAPQGNDAAENGEPYTLFVGPYGAQEPNYTVYWGDGQSSTDARWYTTHAYAYDPSPTANNQYVATLVCAGSTIGYCAPIVYDSGGDGTASISADSDTTDGLLYSVTGTFSDPNQTPPTHYSGPSAMYISWGDGEFDAGYDFEHTYSHAGTYNLEFDAVYEDDNSDPVSGRPVFDVITHKTVVVRPSTPAFDVFSTSGIHVDTTFSPTLYYDDSPYHDQTPQLWTIDWGDGQSASHWGPLPGTFSHAYHQKGPMVINATLTTDYGVYHSAASLTVIGPTIAVIGGGVSATEGESSDPGFQISRGFATNKPLAVNFSLFGQATFGSDYQLLDPEGHILSSSIEIPAGQAFTDVIIHPVDDKIPEWTEPFTLSINPSPENAYTVSPTYYTATAEIVDNDLGISISAPLGPDGKPMLDVNNDDDASKLVPVYLDFPDFKTGAQIAFSADTGEFNIWDSPSKANLILGGATSTITWTYGTGAAPQHTYYAEAIAAGETLGDATFTLTDNDASAAPSVNNPTSNEASSSGTARSVTIISTGVNISGKTPSSAIPVIVGQRIFLTTELAPRAAFSPHPGYIWSGTGNAIYTFFANSNEGTVLPIRNGFPWLTLGWWNGSSQPTLGGTVRTVFVRVADLEISTCFLVKSPVASILTGIPPATLIEFPGVGDVEGELRLGPLHGHGITFNVTNPEIPSGFSGDWIWVQLLSGDESLTTHWDHVTHHRKTTSKVLDTQYTYDVGPSTEDVPHLMRNNKLYDDFGMKDWNADMYLLFRPAGGFPVPIRVVNWTWGGKATWQDPKWVESDLAPQHSASLTDAAAVQFPEWTQNWINIPYAPAVNYQP